MRANVELLRGRVADMLTDTGTISYDTGQKYQDPVTGDELPLFEDRYTGKMLVQAQYGTPQEFDAGGAEWTVTRYDVTLPADTPVKVGDRLEVTTSAFDATLATGRFRIADVRLDSWQIARFCIAERTAS